MRQPEMTVSQPSLASYAITRSVVFVVSTATAMQGASEEKLCELERMQSQTVTGGVCFGRSVSGSEPRGYLVATLILRFDVVE